MTGKKTALACIVIILMTMLSASAAGRFPDPVGHVNDFAGVLSGDTVRKLEGTLRSLAEQTGAEIAVVTVHDMGGMDENTYAVELFEEWGIGSKERDDGLLILVAVEERRLRIEVGYGLEGIITDGIAGRIRDNYMTPYLRKNDYDNGIANGAVAAASLIAKDKGVTLGQTGITPRPVETRRRSSRGVSSFVNLLVMMIVFFLLLGGRRGHGLLAGIFLGSMLGGGRRHYGGGFGGGFGGGGFGGGGGFSGFGGGFSGGGGASGGF